MSLQDELSLSGWQRIGRLSETHDVWLVRHAPTGRLAVEKHLTVYHLDVYRQLMAAPAAHTPRVYAAVESGDTLTVIEEYIPGVPLSEKLAGGPIPEPAAARFALQLCRIVAGLHGSTPPIVHRDIKPSNILVAEDGTLTLVDFNAAKPWYGTADQDTQLIGTAGYAAPEQYGFAESSPRTDQYAIGVLMATMAYGTFSRSSLTQRPFDRIIERCTRIDPADRYPSVTAIVAELSALFQPEVRAALRESAETRTIRALPPGFRSLHPGAMLGMGALYAFLIWAGLTMQVEDAATQTALWIDRICATLGMVGVVFFLGNWLDVWEHAGITRIRSKALRWFVIAAMAVCILFSAAFFSVMLTEFTST